MKQAPKISVIVPVYNVAPYLKDCVDAILSQTFSDLEVLLVDDGSTDDSGLICDAYELSDKRVRVFHTINSGSACARNLGIERARGKFIGFIDGDDWIEPDFYEQLDQMLSHEGVDLAACGFVKIEQREALKFRSDQKQTSFYTPMEALENMFAKDQMRYSACNKLFRRELFKEIRYPNGKSMEDKATTYRLIHASRGIAYNPTPKYHYFIRTDSVSRKTLSAQSFDLFEVNEALMAFIKTYYPQLTELAMTSYLEECVKLLKRIEAEGYLKI